MSLFGFGLGVGTHNSKGDWLEVFYPKPLINASERLANAAEMAGYHGGNETILLNSELLSDLQKALADIGEFEQASIAASMLESDRPCVVTVLASNDKPSTVPEAYLKLHAISHRLVKPHEINLNGVFATLPNVAWTNRGAIDLDEIAEAQFQARLAGDTLEVSCVDKFPKMSNYVVPAGVRIAHTARVRLGAYLGEGTTVMHEGFVNFNAGTEGPGMIEGRISAGVMVGEGSDLGGGCSTMGTLSGGGNIIISVGSGCLIGANAGIGIPLGDRCTVEAGLYLTSGSKVAMIDNHGKQVDTVKARELAGMHDLLFRRNSANGAIECLSNRSAIELNAELHDNN